MDMGLEGVEELQIQLLQQRDVAAQLLVDRIDDHGLARLAVGEQIGVGRRFRIEQLTKYDH